ncbi:MAG: histidinol dehydrogenase [Gammaproteobacteria bacterium]|nr:histidinol dehydrogenase [Gammaproteobacteria bacterium]
MTITRLRTRDADFDQRLERLVSHEQADHASVLATVREIVADVKARGDAALVEYTNRFDARTVANAAELELDGRARTRAAERVAPDLRAALAAAAERIRRYHAHQRLESWTYADEDGTLLGQQVVPLDRVGVYVPGGKAAYPSSVLMNVIPARVAGVGEVVMAVPAPRGEVAPAVLVAAGIAGVDRVFTIGGAQAVAALTYGTATIPAVDKIVGPGNAYVAMAKATVFGAVGIDMIAGPSEILIVCDGGTDPDWIAMDMLAQAEHDERAQAILLSPDAAYLDAVAASIERLLPTLARRDIIRRAIDARAALIEVVDLDEAVALVNRIAPEHLELSVAEPEALARKVRHAGAIFLGRHTPEAFGDYCAGPNHVLPTGRTARFSSPLGVYDFQKRSSLIKVSARGAARLAPLATCLAQGEGLSAHARSAAYRDPGRAADE